MIFLMGISSLPLAFKSNLYHIIWNWKIPQKYPKKYTPIFRGEDDFSYENKFD
jgi:hypothetical protein